MSDVIVRKTKVYEAINRVKLRLAKGGGITKDRTTPPGMAKFQFRGIDDMFNVLCDITAEEGLVMIPRVMSKTIDHGQTANGKAQVHCVLEMEVDYCSAEDGSVHTGRFLGEAMDTGDKACNKAMAAAFKYAHMHTFQIPTHGESDDTEAYVTEAPVTRGKATGPGPTKASPTAGMRAEAQQNGMQASIAGAGNNVVQLPRPEGTTPVEPPSNHLAASAHHAESFAALHEVAKEAHKQTADPATWNVIKNRCVVLLSQAQSVDVLMLAKPIMKDLGSPELLVKAANVRYTELTKKS